MTIGYDVSIGSQRFTNTGSGDRRPLLGIESDIGLGGAPGWCLLHLGDISWADPQLGDAVTVSLDAGDGATDVFTGEVAEVSQRADALWVLAHDGLSKMARVEVESAYEEVTAGFIVSDLVDQAGAEPGEIEDGPSLPSYVVHRGPRALHHAQRLAELCGAELGCDGSGKIHFRRPQSGSAAHRLVWAEDLVEIDVGPRAPVRDSFAVWGEGAAGSQGAERGHWLPTDLSGVSGQAAVQPGAPDQAGSVTAGSTGALVHTVVAGALRSGEAAGDVASARAQLLALRPLAGHAVALGRPAVQPGEWVDLVDVPAGGAGGAGGPGSGPGGRSTRTLTLRVRRVSQQLTVAGGLLTRLEF
ncbi:MAG TPA: hypothetical protein VNM90_10000 [Haliangium sp.]|nr:hypothetical protein [Haliangium sp.]